MRRLVLWAMVAVSLPAAVAIADPPQRTVPSVGAKDLDDFEAKLKADPQYLMRLLAEDRDKGEALIRAGQKQRPRARPWAMDVQMLFAGDVFTGKRLQGKEKVAHFKHALNTCKSPTMSRCRHSTSLTTSCFRERCRDCRSIWRWRHWKQARST